MKCAKSRNAKKSRSRSGSLGTVPGWRSASSLTIRGEAEPTWCTCSSALGRPATNEASGEPRVVGSVVIRRMMSGDLPEQRLGELVHGAAVLVDLAVEQHGRRALHPGVRGRLRGLLDPVLLRQVLDRAPHVLLVGARPDGEVDELVVGEERPGLLGLVLVEQVVQLLGGLGPVLVEHHGERVAERSE